MNSLARAGESGAAGLRAVVEAMVEPALRQLASGDPGWRNSLQWLASVGLLNERHDLLAPWRDRYVPTIRLYHGALATAMPGVPEQVVAWNWCGTSSAAWVRRPNLDPRDEGRGLWRGSRWFIFPNYVQK